MPLYYTLLSLQISSIIIFQIRSVLNHKWRKKASEYKGLGIAKKHLVKLQYAVFDHPSDICKVVESMYKMIEKNGEKSHRYKKLLMLSTLKKAEKDDQFVLRFYNPTKRLQKCFI